MQFRYVKQATLAAAAALTLGLSACANIPASYNTQAEVGGGVVGGVVGNALCGGVLCTAVGALGGAYVGHKMAQSGTFGERHVATYGPAYRPYAYEPAPVRHIHTIRHRHIRHHLRHRHHVHHTY